MTTTFSVLGADLAIKGDVTASADLHIDGHIEGDITCTTLVQGEGSIIHGAIMAQSARLSGTVLGAIKVDQLTILKSARILGDVAYNAVMIELGAHVEGQLSQGLRVTASDSPIALVS
jgi:cytoskeletal protein CcmA (bactofilin family)